MRTSRWIAVALLAGCGGTTAPPALPAWDKTLPEASVMGVRRGLTPARGIVHLHSPYSHDACDNNPRPNGLPDEKCLGDLRTALCIDHIDFADLTDHDDTMADEDFTKLFSMRGSDQPVMRGADQIASRILCDDGHQVLVTVGGENDLMPIMLDHHVPGTVQERHDIYNANDAAASAAYRAAGGLVWVAHTESKSLDTLHTVTPDGIEVYNLHANIDPKIRQDWLGLPSADAIASAVNFADTQPGHPEPDLALLAFLTPNLPAIDKWQTLLGEGTKITVTAGSDAHQNALPVTLADGERGDSYRRVLRWFGNEVLVADPHDVDQIKAGLKAGRVYATFELFGTPEGFDTFATTPGGQTIELGGTVPAAQGAVLTVNVPTVLGLDPTLPAPTITGKVTWINNTGAHELARGTGTFQANMGAPGAYRVEITITPSHLGPYLGDLGSGMAETELPWIYTSPIYVQ